MNVLVASSVRWTMAVSSLTSDRRRGGVALEQALDDLGLEHDVGEALGRPVVHRPGDVAAEVLLGRQHHSPTMAGCGPPVAGPPRVGTPPGPSPRRRRRQRRHGLADAGEPLAVALQRLLLAREHVELGTP